MDQQKCYIYRQPRSKAMKRPKLEPTGVETSLELRKTAYRAAWAQQEDQFDTLVKGLNQSILHEIEQYIATGKEPLEAEALRVAFVVVGPTGASSDVLFDQLRLGLSKHSVCFVSLNASDAPNLKTLLKNLIRKATNENSGFDDDLTDAQLERTTQRRLLNYDLQILFEWCQSQGKRIVVVSMQDIEAFESTILTDTLVLLKSWLDRIEFKLVLGVATSLELFEDRLPNIAVRCMSGRLFYIPKPEDALEVVFQESVTAEKSVVRLGPTLVADFMQRQHDHMQSVQDFKQILKYAYMSHFYADPISIFLHEQLERHSVSIEHFEAVRNLPSFRKRLEDMLRQNSITSARDLLESDDALFEAISEQLITGRRTVIWTMGACAAVRAIRSHMVNKEAVPFSALYTRALSGTLQGSALLRETFMFASMSDSSILQDLLIKVADILIVMPPANIDVSPEDFHDLQNELARLTEEHGKLEAGSAMQTAGSLSTSRRAGASKQRAAAAASQQLYNDILKRFDTLIANYLDKAMTPMKDIFLHELLFYDLKSPHRDVFTPKPRVAIERALSAPQDYLGCECCAEGMHSTLPATSVLYQLYLESGALINAYDLWSAFRAVVIDQYPDEPTTMALFFRSLAELKHMGMVKQSRKRTDCLAKMAWKGL